MSDAVTTYKASPTTVGITLVSNFQIFFSSRARSWYLSISSCYFSSLVSPVTVMSIKSAILLSSLQLQCLSVCVQSRGLAGFSHLCLYDWLGIVQVPLFRTRHVILLTHTQWTAPATLSCVLLYSSLLHSLVKCAIVSSLSLHVFFLFIYFHFLLFVTLSSKEFHEIR